MSKHLCQEALYVKIVKINKVFYKKLEGSHNNSMMKRSKNKDNLHKKISKNLYKQKSLQEIYIRLNKGMLLTHFILNNTNISNYGVILNLTQGILHVSGLKNVFIGEILLIGGHYLAMVTTITKYL